MDIFVINRALILIAKNPFRFTLTMGTQCYGPNY